MNYRYKYRNNNTSAAGNWCGVGGKDGETFMWLLGETSMAPNLDSIK